MGSGGAGGGGGTHGGGWRGICATSTLARLDALNCFFFFCCIAERAIKPCRSSRSKLRGKFGIPRHLQNRNQNTTKTKKTKQEHKTNKRQKSASVGM